MGFEKSDNMQSIYNNVLPVQVLLICTDSHPLQVLISLVLMLLWSSNVTTLSQAGGLFGLV